MKDFCKCRAYFEPSIRRGYVILRRRLFCHATSSAKANSPLMLANGLEQVQFRKLFLCNVMYYAHFKRNTTTVEGGSY